MRTLIEILEYLMDTSIAIFGSTDDVELIEKNQEKLLMQMQDTIHAELREIVKKCKEHSKADIRDLTDIYNALDTFCGVDKEKNG